MPMIDSDKLKPASDAAVAAALEWKDAGAALRAANEKGEGVDEAMERMEATGLAFHKASAEVSGLVRDEIEQAERAAG